MKLVHIFKTLIWLHRTAWWSPRACRSKFWFWVELCCVSCIVSCAHLVCSRSEVCTGVNFRSCHQSETEDSTQGLQNKILKKEKKVEIFLKRSQTVRGLFFVFLSCLCVCCGWLAGQSIISPIYARMRADSNPECFKVLSSLQEEEKVENVQLYWRSGGKRDRERERELMCSLRIRREHQQSRSPCFSHHSPIRNSFKCPSASPKMTTENR